MSFSPSFFLSFFLSFLSRQSRIWVLVLVLGHGLSAAPESTWDGGHVGKTYREG